MVYLIPNILGSPMGSVQVVKRVKNYLLFPKNNYQKLKLLFDILFLIQNTITASKFPMFAFSIL